MAVVYLVQTAKIKYTQILKGPLNHPFKRMMKIVTHNNAVA